MMNLAATLCVTKMQMRFPHLNRQRLMAPGTPSRLGRGGGLLLALLTTTLLSTPAFAIPGVSQGSPFPNRGGGQGEGLPRTASTTIDGQSAVLAAYAGGQAPTANADGVQILSGATNEANAVAFDRQGRGCYRHVHASWSMTIGTGGEGASFVLLDTARYGTKGAPKVASSPSLTGRAGVGPASSPSLTGRAGVGPASSPSLTGRAGLGQISLPGGEGRGGVNWDDPRLPGCFAAAFDIDDPPTDNPFNTDRNIDGNPQREVALYWDGNEITRMVSPVEFRTSTPHAVDVDIDYVCGGADIDLLIDNKPIYQGYFIPCMQPYESRALFGGRSGDIATKLEIGSVDIAYTEPVGSPQAPLIVDAIASQPLDNGHHEQSSTVDFPADTSKYGRIICTLTLAKPDAGYDPWDRRASIYAVDDSGERFEIVRFITPYHCGYTWQVDVTDYRPLLQGRHQIVANCVTYSTGWLTSISFRFYPGKTDRLAYKVVHLWTGDAEIGNLDKPASTFFTPQHITRDTAADFVKLRFIVTGHGQAPNTDDAAEFLPLSRTVTVDGHDYTNMLWKTDNGFNPCSPQGGTWKYDRAGWGPGSVVTPWDIDITRLMSKSAPTDIEYAVGDYKNTSRDNGNPPVHWVESQIIYYRKAH